MTLRDLLQELCELGPGGVAFRIRWEVQQRAQLTRFLQGGIPVIFAANIPAVETIARLLPFDGAVVAASMQGRIPADDITALVARTDKAAGGTIRMFGRWDAAFGSPPDWQLNPVNGQRWPAQRHWAVVLRDGCRVGDVKLTWEIGRFPHAYEMARAAVLFPERRDGLARALADQIRAFVEENPYALGVHWVSGQEIAFRLMAWVFALGAMGERSPLGEIWPSIARHLHDGACHIERHLDYARKAVYNNHLLSEALGLLVAGTLLPQAPQAKRWRDEGERILTGQTDRQFYADGAYIQLSHNYERVALQVYLFAMSLKRGAGAPIPEAWCAAVARGADFLYSHQNPADGRVPNYGANDGALPAILSTCDYSDFRPTIQAASIAGHGARRYPPGPWDEEAAWLLGPDALKAPLRERTRRSISFGATGFHVLRGRDEDTFAAFRCGTIRDRFSQIDMLHLDVWWRGENVLVDGGSYLYNGPKEWHDHFMRTQSHNTVTIDGRDQMKHYRKFKPLYWTEAKLLGFEDQPRWALVAGEHYGYRRVKGSPVHQRSVLQVKDGLWVVVDRVAGDGQHDVRLQWMGGEYGYEYDRAVGTLLLKTGHEDFRVAVMNQDGTPLEGDVIAGASRPPRGWLSRYYGEKVPVPSLAVRRRGILPMVFVTILSGRGRARATAKGENWQVSCDSVTVAFRLVETGIEDVRLQ